jgi:radical SAM superfamily enzyme YgiQ (UPF0313 family)
MSHHGLQVLYSLMNRREDWCAERVFTPWPDMERLLREKGIPLYSLETFTALSDFDVLGLSLQYEISAANVLTMLDLGGIPLEAVDRTLADPLVVAGGPCCQNPEPMADFFDVMIIGDGEPALPALCDAWIEEKHQAIVRDGELLDGTAGRRQREEALANIASRMACAYVPRFYQPEYADGRVVNLWAVVPLYAEEAAKKLAHGAEALFDGFDEHGVNEILVVDRPNVAI